MKFCTSCGHKVSPSDRFCSNCGMELSHVTDNAGFIKSDLKVQNIISDTKKSAKKVRKLLLPTLSVFIVGGVALVAYKIIKDQEQEKVYAVRDQALQEQEAKQRLIKLEECVLENFANAHGNSKKVWSYLKVMCSLKNAEVGKYQNEWGKNLELLKNKRAKEAMIVH
ncbi:zinc-ribbon domain-containing protein [Sulfurovum sp. TSL1]|uniref:zinc-ribbon domain-containing protein n=1 Tax=Sulfurovum sp. TSL1 TaxID=2826994 RepID=UPI001CC3984D|nr:zinc ribbon domain-containing protein [Sulfurovum sp. TSL1]GIT97591.1 hypothetical protein TSL1_04120 [Sulfurovum sp. TSL1]